MHRELVNSTIKYPKKFNINDVVMKSVHTQSNKTLGRVDKLSYSLRGPFRITALSTGGSYILSPLKGGASIKKHGSNLILCPKEIIPSTPLDSSDTGYGSIHKNSIHYPSNLSI